MGLNKVKQTGVEGKKFYGKRLVRKNEFFIILLFLPHVSKKKRECVNGKFFRPNRADLNLIVKRLFPIEIRLPFYVSPPNKMGFISLEIIVERMPDQELIQFGFKLRGPQGGAGLAGKKMDDRGMLFECKFKFGHGVFLMGNDGVNDVF